MIYKTLHGWDVTPAEAVKLQMELRSKLSFECEKAVFNTIAGIHVAFDSASNNGFAAIAVFELGRLCTIETATASLELKFPYTPGLLSFRESPVVIEAWTKLRTLPDCIICNGQGTAHPRRFGIACHLGLIFDVPAIGCAKSVLVGRYKEPAPWKGSFEPLIDRKETVGAALRTKDHVEPVFVSPGHKINLEKAIEVILRSCTKYRLPEPTRQADLAVDKAKQGVAPQEYSQGSLF